MDRGAWWVTVYGIAKSQDMIQQLTLSLSEMRCSYKFLRVILLNLGFSPETFYSSSLFHLSKWLFTWLLEAETFVLSLISPSFSAPWHQGDVWEHLIFSDNCSNPSALKLLEASWSLWITVFKLMCASRSYEFTAISYRIYSLSFYT